MHNKYPIFTKPNTPWPIPLDSLQALAFSQNIQPHCLWATTSGRLPENQSLFLDKVSEQNLRCWSSSPTKNQTSQWTCLSLRNSISTHHIPVSVNLLAISSQNYCNRLYDFFNTANRLSSKWQTRPRTQKGYQGFL
jgi:hypothetical protein